MAVARKTHLSPVRLLGMMKGLLVMVVTFTSLPSRVACTKAMGSTSRRKMGRGIILKRIQTRSR